MIHNLLISVNMRVIILAVFTVSLWACKSENIQLHVGSVGYLSAEEVVNRRLETFKEHNDLIRFKVTTNYDLEKTREQKGYITQFFIYKCRDVSRHDLIDSGSYESVISVKEIELKKIRKNDDEAAYAVSYEIISTFLKNDDQHRVNMTSYEVCIFSRLLNMTRVKSLSSINKIALENYNLMGSE